MLALLLSGSIHAEAARQANITKDFNDVPLKEVLNEVENELQYSVIYKKGEVNEAKLINQRFENATLEEVLSAVLDKGLDFKIEGKMIVITRAQRGSAGKVARMQQSRKTVSGVVRDEQGVPVIGANVLEKGTSNGTITDMDGRYTLQVAEGATLQISYIGYGTKEMKVAGQSSIDVQLAEDSEALSEVVVVGYGVQRKVTTSGAVTKLEGDDINKMTVVNATKALQGLSSGITVVDRGGAPGSDDPEIYLRGVGTTGDAKPLILVDGIEMSLSQVPASEIENISVLKDAASASIYGSRAAHGVILVTTKRGKEGKLTVSYNGTIGFQDRAVKPKGVSAREYMEMVNESLLNAGSALKYTEDDILATENGSDPYHHVYNDWLGEVYKPAYITQHTLSMNGGTETSRYLLSFDYLDQPGLTDNTNYKRYNYRVNTDFNIGKMIKLSSDVTYRHIDRLWPEGLGTAQSDVWSMQPTSPIRYENGDYALDKQNRNAVSVLDMDVVGEDEYDMDALYGQLKLDFEPIKDLVFTGMASLNGSWDRRKVHYKNHKYYNEDGVMVTQRNNPNSVADTRNNDYQLTLRFLANYKKKFNEKHDFAVLYGMERISYRKYYSFAQRKDLISDELPDVSLGSASSQFAEGYPTMWGINSFFGRINYGYMDKYLVEANVRADGSSRFAKGNKWGVFPSFSAAWRLSEEGFIKDLNFFDNLKLRASWGQTGNERIDEFMYLPQFGTENVIMNGQLVTAIRQTQMANPDVTWETVEQTNVGLDFSFLNNSIYGELDWYSKDTKDILLALGIPHFIGLDAPEQNAGVVRNSGFEAMLGFRKKLGEVNFSASVNVSYNKNRWIDRGGDDTNIDGWTIQALDSPLNAFYIYEADGLIANDQELAEYKAKYKEDPRGMSVLKAGDVKLVDVNGDGTIDPDDRQIYNSNIPKFIYGINLSVGYKNWELAVDMMGQAGNEIYRTWDNYNWSQFNFLAQRLGRWHGEGTSNSQPLLDTTHTINNLNSEYYIEDGSFFRIRNLSLAYNFDQKLISKIGLQALKIYANIQNLKTWKHNTGFTPEMGGTATAFGVDAGSYPMPAIYTFGFNLTF